MVRTVDAMFVEAGFPCAMSEVKIFDSSLKQRFLDTLPSPPHGLIADSGYQGLGSYGIVAHIVHKKDHLLTEQEVKENHKV